MKIEDIKIGDTRLGNWSDAMDSHPFCRLMWKFNLIVLPTMVFLEVWYF